MIRNDENSEKRPMGNREIIKPIMFLHQWQADALLSEGYDAVRIKVIEKVIEEIAQKTRRKNGSVISKTSQNRKA